MEHKFILMLVVFLSSFVFVTTMFNTEAISASINNSYDVTWNGTIYSNMTVGSEQGALPTPPICNISWDIIEMVKGCVGGNIIYFWNIMTFRTEIAWLNILIIIPMIIVLGFILVRVLIDVLRVIAEAIPF